MRYYPVKVNSLFWIIAGTIFLSCKKEDASPLAGCCDIPAINEAVGNGHIYVPNIFTPNHDGRNDEFGVFTDSIRWITQLEIKNDQNEIVLNVTAFQPGNFNSIWDGEINGVVQKGMYSITMLAEADNGVAKVLHGKVCNFPCDDDMPDDPIDATHCQFPAQNDAGYFNHQLPSGEGNECFTN